MESTHWKIENDGIRERLALELARNTLLNKIARKEDPPQDLISGENLASDISFKDLVIRYKSALTQNEIYETNRDVDTVYFPFKNLTSYKSDITEHPTLHFELLKSEDLADPYSGMIPEHFYFYKLRQHLRVLRRLTTFYYFQQHLHDEVTSFDNKTQKLHHKFFEDNLNLYTSERIAKGMHLDEYLYQLAEERFQIKKVVITS